MKKITPLKNFEGVIVGWDLGEKIFFVERLQDHILVFTKSRIYEIHPEWERPMISGKKIGI